MEETKNKKLAPFGQRPRRPVNKGYGDAGASFTKKALKGFLASSGSAHEDIDANNRTLRQRARMLYMASPLATSAIKTNRTNVIGCGLQLKSRINRDRLGLTAEQAKVWQRRTEEEFELWAANKVNCDAIGINNFYTAQQLAFASELLSGDVIVLLQHDEPTQLNPYGLRFHIIEADRLSTPVDAVAGGLVFNNLTQGKTEDGHTIYDGVEADENGKIVAYHIRNTYPYEQTTKETKWIRVEAYGKETGLPNVLHIMQAERPSNIVASLIWRRSSNRFYKCGDTRTASSRRPSSRASSLRLSRRNWILTQCHTTKSVTAKAAKATKPSRE